LGERVPEGKGIQGSREKECWKKQKEEIKHKFR
jgi:hypothetical protein